MRHTCSHSRYMNNNIDDETLMLRLQQSGDFQAFESLFRRHKDAFVTFLARLSGNLAIAEDVSQQVWVGLIDVARNARYSPKAKFRTYLYTLGRNRYIDEYHRRHEATRTEPYSGDETVRDPAHDAGGLPEQIAAVDEHAQVLNQAIATLPLDQRDVIAMWASGMGFDLIGEITRAPRDTVISRKKYAIRKLRAALEAQGIGEGTL